MEKVEKQAEEICMVRKANEALPEVLDYAVAGMIQTNRMHKNPPTIMNLVYKQLHSSPSSCVPVSDTSTPQRATPSSRALF